jgi:hypothetical protein
MPEHRGLPGKTRHQELHKNKFVSVVVQASRLHFRGRRDACTTKLLNLFLRVSLAEKSEKTAGDEKLIRERIYNGNARRVQEEF